MNEGLKQALCGCETDLEGALYRFGNDEELYIACLQSFLHDSTMTGLENAIRTEDWDGAFTAAHALKGMAGNMGFVPLFHATARIVVLIRNGKINEVIMSFASLKRSYLDIAETIQKYCIAGGIPE